MGKRGPLPRFDQLHIRETLEIIAETGKASRGEIAKRLGIGEGSVRTILKLLKEKGLLTSSRGGHALTEKGKRALGNLQPFVRVDAGELVVGRVGVATIVREAAKRVKKGIEQRDEAIKVGAKGATTLIYHHGRFILPGLEGFEVPKSLEKVLLENFRPREGDVIVIGSGDDVLSAERGARAAALSLRRASDLCTSK